MILKCPCSTRCAMILASTTRASVAAWANAARKITTLAGLGTPEKPHKLQTAWIEEQVNQCAYCISGWIMTGAELLARNPHPTEDEIRDAFSDLICRCGTHNAAIKAVKRAAEKA